MDIKGLKDEGVSGDGNLHKKEREMECLDHLDEDQTRI